MNAADRAISIETLTTMFSGEIAYHDNIAFYLYENINRNLVTLLRSHDIRVTSVYKQGQIGERADTLLLGKARTMGCVMVAIDRDFKEISDRIVDISGLSQAGVILVISSRLRISSDQLAARLARLVDKFEGFSDVLQNQVYTV